MSRKIGKNVRELLLMLSVSAFIISSCDDPSGPDNNGEPVLSVTGHSHFHCELEWTLVDLDGWNHDSYKLYRSESPDIAADTTGLCIATYTDADQLLHIDQTLESSTTYYYSLLTTVLSNEGRDIDYLWSDEQQETTDKAYHVEFVNTSGRKMYLAINRDDNYWMRFADPGTKWISPENVEVESCRTSIENGESISFDLPTSSDSHGFRMFFGESDSVIFINDLNLPRFPDLATATFLYDKIEGSSWNHIGGIWNTTCVDFFAIPSQISANLETRGFTTNTTRSQIMTALHSTALPYSDLSFHGEGVSACRFFSPGHFKNDPGMTSDSLADALAHGLSVHNGTTWTVDEFTFSNIQYNAADASLSATGTYNLHTDCVVLNNINTANALACDFPIVATDSTIAFKLVSLVSAAANRGVLYDTNLWKGDYNNYYQDHPDDNFRQYNYYAKVLHSYSRDNRCYAFAYDDINDRHSGMSVDPENNVLITIMSCD